MKRVLIVDNEGAFCSLVKDNLESGGAYEVIICVESDAAVKMAKEMIPDVILLDVVMPDRSGIDIAIELKSESITKGIPIIFLSALTGDDEFDECKHIIGEPHLVSKPVSKLKLLEALKCVLEKGLDET